MKKCKCKIPTLTDKEQTNYIYIVCEECNGWIERKPEICVKYNIQGECEYSKTINCEAKCKVNGKWIECASAKRLFHKEEK